MRLLAVAALATLALAAPAAAATPDGGYRLPPAPIAAMLDAAPTPTVSISHDRRMLAVFGRENLPSVGALARPILRLGGWRVDPRTNGPAEIRMNWLTSLAVQGVTPGTVRNVSLPRGMRFTDPVWSPDDRRIAFVAEAPSGLEIWVADASSGAARRLTPAVVNAAFGVRGLEARSALAWAPDSRSIVFRRTLATRGAAPAEPSAPSGPTVQENLGRAAPSRTYEDLLANAHDEALFDYYFTSQLARVDVGSGAMTTLGAPGVISRVDLSPDGRFVLVERLHRPYSYLVTSREFPTLAEVWDASSGRVVHKVADRPLADDLPIAFDSVSKGPRDIEWRADAPATLVWAEAQDGGDPNAKVEVHDRLLALDAPFAGAPRTLADLKLRYRGVEWGKADAALVTERWWRNRHETRLVIDPSGRPPRRAR